MDTGESVLCKPFDSYGPSCEISSATGTGTFMVPLAHTRPTETTVGPITTEHSFSLCPTAGVNLLGKDLLCSSDAQYIAHHWVSFLDVPDLTLNEASQFSSCH